MMMKFKAIIFFIGLCLSDFGYAQTQPNNFDEKTINVLRVEASEVQAQLDAKRRQIKAQEKTAKKSTAGLDKRKQLVELYNTILYMYGNELSITFMQKKIETIPVKSQNKDIVERKITCLKNTFNYDDFQKYVYQKTLTYVENHTEHRLQKDLKLLIDSGLSSEFHEGIIASWTAKNESDKLTASNLFKLHLLQQPQLQSAFNDFVNNPEYSELKTLTGFTSSQYKLLNVKFFDEKVKQCNIKDNELI